MDRRKVRIALDSLLPALYGLLGDGSLIPSYGSLQTGPLHTHALTNANNQSDNAAQSDDRAGLVPSAIQLGQNFHGVSICRETQQVGGGGKQVGEEEEKRVVSSDAATRKCVNHSQTMSQTLGGPRSVSKA